MAQDGRWDPSKNPQQKDAQRVKDGVSGNSAEGQGAQKEDAFHRNKAEPDVIHKAATFPPEKREAETKN